MPATRKKPIAKAKDGSHQGKLRVANIPDNLKRLDQWACWRYVTQPNGKEGKPPFNPKTGDFANPADPSTWVSFQDALNGYKSGEYDGISFLLSPNDNIVGVDFDDCRNPSNKRINTTVAEALAGLNSYTEVSPSGRGIRVFLCGSLPPAGRRKGKFEVYDQAKALTVTGRRLSTYPATINENPEALLDFHARFIGGKEATKKERVSSIEVRPDVEPQSAKVNVLCRQFRKVKPLVAGDYSEYASPSDAEQALANYAAGAGWSDQEITDLLVSARINSGEDPKAETYYRATIATARSSKLAQRNQGKPDKKTPKKPLSRKTAPKTLAQVKETFNKYLYLEDDTVLDLVLGTAAGIKLPGDPLWLYVIGAVSCGKSEILATLNGRDDSFFLDDISTKALISGYVDPTDKGEDKSILPKLDGKVLVIKDLTVLLTKSKESRNELFGYFRAAYDGSFSRGMGTDTKAFASRFNLIAGTTPAVEGEWSYNAPLGERFLSYRMRVKDRMAHALKGLSHNGQDFRRELKEAVWGLLDNIPQVVPEYTNEMTERTVLLADILARTRTVIHRDGRHATHDVEPELCPRVAKQLKRIGQSVALVRGKDRVTAEEFKVMRKVAFDSLPSQRARTLQALWDNRKMPRSVKQLQPLLDASETTVRRMLDDFRDLQMVDATESNGRIPTRKYQLTKGFKEMLSAMYED